MNARTGFEQVAAFIDAKVVTLQKAEDRVSKLETALAEMIDAHESLSADTEGKYPMPDTGCIECTVGTVPNNRNTGLCAYHGAKRLLGQP